MLNTSFVKLDIFIMLYPGVFCLIFIALLRLSLKISNLSVIYTLVSNVVVEPKTVKLDVVKFPSIIAFPVYVLKSTDIMPFALIAVLVPCLTPPKTAVVAIGNCSLLLVTK